MGFCPYFLQAHISEGTFSPALGLFDTLPKAGTWTTLFCSNFLLFAPLALLGADDDSSVSAIRFSAPALALLVDGVESSWSARRKLRENFVEKFPSDRISAACDEELVPLEDNFATVNGSSSAAIRRRKLGWLGKSPSD